MSIQGQHSTQKSAQRCPEGYRHHGTSACIFSTNPTQAGFLGRSRLCGVPKARCAANSSDVSASESLKCSRVKTETALQGYHKKSISPHNIDENALTQFRLFISGSVCQGRFSSREGRHLCRHNVSAELSMLAGKVPDSVVLCSLCDQFPFCVKNSMPPIGGNSAANLAVLQYLL